MDSVLNHLIIFIVSSVVMLFIMSATEMSVDGMALDSRTNQFISRSTLGMYNRAAVSTDAAQCAKIGKDTLQKNGSTVDAAIATLLCMNVVIPESMGLGGGFFMTLYIRDEKTAKVLDAREVAPLKASKYMFKGQKSLSQIGGLSIAVPGQLRGFREAWKKYGTLSWSELFNPSIKLCEDGFPVGKHFAESLTSNKEIIRTESTLRTLFWNTNTNDVYKENEIFRYHIMAETLRNISNENDNAKTFGQFEKHLVEDIQSFDGIITEQDFLAYSPQWREPVQMSFQANLTMYSTPPPGSGALLGFILNVLDGYHLNETSFSTVTQKIRNYHRVIEAFKFAFAKRMELEDPGEPNTPRYKRVEKLANKLTSKEFSEEILQKIDDYHTFEPSYYGVETFLSEDKGTSHVSIVAPNGDAVAITSTINSRFGSKRASPSTGVVLNNEMDDFSSPGITNAYDFQPSHFNTISPGKRPLSSMSPTIIVDNKGDVKLVIGGTGGSMILSGISWVILNTLWAGRNIKEAIDSPRIHHQLLPNILMYEPNFSEEVLCSLRKFGHKLQEFPADRMSIIMAVARGSDGNLYSNSDYRKNGDTDGF
ncbi:scoloptoxin SSD14-like [Tachypleus tridentatus]|uniref:scoloptoxin SSD14-like n=1 Tax=Tachypleus tridentatus TaxID=6853 RepID=UPI003FD094FE